MAIINVTLHAKKDCVPHISGTELLQACKLAFSAFFNTLEMCWSVAMVISYDWKSMHHYGKLKVKKLHLKFFTQCFHILPDTHIMYCSSSMLPNLVTVELNSILSDCLYDVGSTNKCSTIAHLWRPWMFQVPVVTIVTGLHSRHYSVALSCSQTGSISVALKLEHAGTLLILIYIIVFSQKFAFGAHSLWRVTKKKPHKN